MSAPYRSCPRCGAAVTGACDPCDPCEANMRARAMERDAVFAEMVSSDAINLIANFIWDGHYAQGLPAAERRAREACAALRAVIAGKRISADLLKPETSSQ